MEKSIGTCIAAQRKAKGMTQKELAEKLHVSDKTVSRWERGESEPELSVLPVLTELLDVTLEELIAGEKDISEKKEAGTMFPLLSMISLGIGFTGLFAAAIYYFVTENYIITFGVAMAGLVPAFLLQTGACVWFKKTMWSNYCLLAGGFVFCLPLFIAMILVKHATGVNRAETEGMIKVFKVAAHLTKYWIAYGAAMVGIYFVFLRMPSIWAKGVDIYKAHCMKKSTNK